MASLQKKTMLILLSILVFISVQAHSSPNKPNKPNKPTCCNKASEPEIEVMVVCPNESCNLYFPKRKKRDSSQNQITCPFCAMEADAGFFTYLDMQDKDPLSTLSVPLSPLPLSPLPTPPWDERTEQAPDSIELTLRLAEILRGNGRYNLAISISAILHALERLMGISIEELPVLIRDYMAWYRSRSSGRGGFTTVQYRVREEYGRPVGRGLQLYEVHALPPGYSFGEGGLSGNVERFNYDSDNRHREILESIFNAIHSDFPEPRPSIQEPTNAANPFFGSYSGVTLDVRWAVNMSRIPPAIRFRQQDGEALDFIPMGFNDTSVRYSSYDVWQMVELPYLYSEDGRRLRMLAVLPPVGVRLSEFSSALFMRLAQSLSERTVRLRMPPFLVSNSYNLAESASAGNFLGDLLRPSNFRPSLIIPPLSFERFNSYHSIAFLVDEQGSQAEAVTTIEVDEACAVCQDALEVVFDHPFLVMVVDEYDEIHIYAEIDKLPKR